MDRFYMIYRILRTLEKSLDLDEPEMTAISAEYSGVSVPKRSRLMKMKDKALLEQEKLCNTIRIHFPALGVSAAKKRHNLGIRAAGS